MNRYSFDYCKQNRVAYGNGSEPLQNHNPAYLLQPGELNRIFAPFNGDILYSEEIWCGEIPTARLLFKKNQASP